MSERIKKAKRRYAIEMLVAMTLYCVVLWVALSVAKQTEPGPLLVALSLVPIAPLLAAWYAFFRFFRHMDEMQKRITADSAALTLAIGILAAIMLGFLRRFGVMSVENDMTLFGPFLIGVWTVIRFLLGGRDC